MSDVINTKEKLMVEMLLAKREAYVKCCSILKGEYFDQPLDRVVEYMKQHFNKHHTLPSVDIIEAETGVELKERQEEEADESYLLEAVEEFCSREAMNKAILDSVDLVESGEIEKVQQIVRDALMVKIDNNLGTSLFEDIRERIERTRVTRTGYKMGIPGIDDINGGQWYKGELYMFAGATSTGKSIMLANAVDRMAAQGLDCLIVSVEMDEDPYSVRLDSIITGMEIGTDIDDLSSELYNKANDYGRINIKRVNNKFGLEDLRAYLMEYHLQYGKYPDLVALDYIDIFANGTHLNKLSVFDRDEIKSHSFRDIMIDYDMMGFTACQLNRDSYNDVMMVSIAHIQGGISKAQACEAVIAMVATDEDIDNNQLQFKGIKVRNAEKSSSMTTIYRCPKTLRLSDTPFNGAIPKPTKTPIDKTANKSNNSKAPLKGKAKLKEALKGVK